ncbi:hypothetical protein [Catellatospora vulcania]|uniref:hypothetical protein n=1 Tax=Catellatospora vulcania TaxID=1460450 RepID=UPI0012D44D1E|nr:hypothetical protein [Catellatospora vulcania]
MKTSGPLAVLVLAAALATAACTADTPGTTPASSGAPGAPAATASAGSVAGTGDGCLTGKWAADVDAMAKAAARLGGGEGKGTGSITLEFADQLTITYDNAVISIKSTVSGATVEGKTTLNGSATSTSYTTKDGKIGGVMPGGKITTKSVMTMNGVETPLPNGAFDGNLDLAKNTVSYTCSGDRAQLSNGYVSWPLTKVS